MAKETFRILLLFSSKFINTLFCRYLTIFRTYSHTHIYTRHTRTHTLTDSRIHCRNQNESTCIFVMLKIISYYIWFSGVVKTTNKQKKSKFNEQNWMRTGNLTQIWIGKEIQPKTRRRRWIKTNVNSVRTTFVRIQRQPPHNNNKNRLFCSNVNVCILHWSPKFKHTFHTIEIIFTIFFQNGKKKQKKNIHTAYSNN